MSTKKIDSAPKTTEVPEREKNAEGKKAVYGPILTKRAMMAAAHRVHPRISVNEMAVMIGLFEYADKTGWCRVSQNTLALRLGLRREHVNRAMAGLVEHGIIEARSRADGVTLGYQFVQDQWKYERPNMDEVNEAREQKELERAERKAAAAKTPEERERDDQLRLEEERECIEWQAEIRRKGAENAERKRREQDMLADAKYMADHAATERAIADIRAPYRAAFEELKRAASQDEIARLQDRMAALRADGDARADEITQAHRARWPQYYGAEEGQL